MMNHCVSKRWLLDRRHVLRGLGVSLALPMLDCMRPLHAADKGERPRRSVFIYLPNGVNTSVYQMKKAGRDYELSAPLKSLEKHRDIMTPFSGLYHPHGLGHHHNCSTIWLTGGKIGASERNTISLDQLIARQTARETRISSIKLATEGHSLSFNADGIRIPAEKNPKVVFAELFEEPKGGVDKQRRGLQRQGSILDAILGEANKLGSQLGRDDRGRLDQYLTAVREVEVRTERADMWLDVPRPKIDKSVAAKLNRSISLQQLGEYQRTLYDILVLAFQTDMTRVATFSTGREGIGPAVPEIGVTQDRHSLSHHNGHPKLLADLAASDTFYFQQFSYLLDRLCETEDADGPLIETTMALYGSGMAYGHSHGNASLPLVLAGGTKLGFRHGSHVDYNLISSFQGYDKHRGIYHSPVNTKAHMSNLLLTMGQKMGLEIDQFADSNGTISEVEA